MAFPDFAATAETDRERGGHVFVQCLPKMGSTALSRSLSNAAHEVDVDGPPLLMQHQVQPDLDALRWSWLSERRQALGTTIVWCSTDPCGRGYAASATEASNTPTILCGRRGIRATSTS